MPMHSGARTAAAACEASRSISETMRRTDSTVAARWPLFPFRIRETVAVLTLARSATCRMVAFVKTMDLSVVAFVIIMIEMERESNFAVKKRYRKMIPGVVKFD